MPHRTHAPLPITHSPSGNHFCKLFSISTTAMHSGHVSGGRVEPFRGNKPRLGSFTNGYLGQRHRHRRQLDLTCLSGGETNGVSFGVAGKLFICCPERFRCGWMDRWMPCSPCIVCICAVRWLIDTRWTFGGLSTVIGFVPRQQKESQSSWAGIIPRACLQKRSKVFSHLIGRKFPQKETKERQYGSPHKTTHTMLSQLWIARADKQTTQKDTPSSSQRSPAPLPPATRPWILWVMLLLVLLNVNDDEDCGTVTKRPESWS